jgi:protein gp37
MFRDKKRYGQDPTKVVRSKPPTFRAPLKWNAKRIFVCSWSDFMIEEADGEWRTEALDIIYQTPWHTYMILTKRSERIRGTAWPDNVWLGVTVEDKDATVRLNDLMWTTARVRFVSCEPLLESVNLTPWLRNLDWVITGGESGKEARPMREEWAVEIIKDCQEWGVPVFHKQNGGMGRDMSGVYGGETINGKVYQKLPKIAR